MTSLVCAFPSPSLMITANAGLVWAAMEEDDQKRRALGVQAELDRRRQAEAEAEARRQEIRGSIR